MEDVNKRTLSFGNTKIDYDSYMDSIASDVDNYVNRLPWSNKRKLLFMEAYTALARNLDAFDNTDGRYSVRTFEDPNLNPNLSDKKGLEMLGEAAYYMIDKAKRASKIEDKKEADKPVYDYNTHLNNGIGAYIRDHIFGGRQFSVDDEWLKLDSVDTNTKTRNITNRKNILADILDLYADSFDGTKYNFEGSPYAGGDDVKKRLKDVAAKLRSTNTIDESTKLALNSIGIDPEKWFALKSNAELQAEAATLLSGETQQSGTTNLLNTTELNKKAPNPTARRWLYIPKDFSITKEELAKKYKHGEDAFNKINARIQSLLELAYNGGDGKANLTTEERKELSNLLFFTKDYNPKYANKWGISNEELSTLSSDGLFKGNGSDTVRLPWKTSDGHSIYLRKNGELYFKNVNGKIGANNISEGDYAQFKKNFLLDTHAEGRHAPVGGLADIANWSTGDKLLLASAATDLASAIAAFAPGYGTAVSAITGIGSTIMATVGDVKNDNFSAWNTLFRVAMDAVSVLPMFNIPATGAKVGKALMGIAPKVLHTIGLAGFATQMPDAYSAWKKIAAGKGSEITKEELGALVNSFTYLTGATSSRVTAARRDAILANKTKNYTTTPIGEKTADSYSVKIGDKEIPLTKTQHETLNGTGDRKGKEAVLKKAYKDHTSEEITNDQLNSVFSRMSANPMTWFNKSKVSGTSSTSGSATYKVTRLDGKKLHWLKDSDARVLNFMSGRQPWNFGIPGWLTHKRLSASEIGGGTTTKATTTTEAATTTGTTTTKPKSVTLPDKYDATKYKAIREDLDKIGIKEKEDKDQFIRFLASATGLRKSYSDKKPTDTTISRKSKWKDKDGKSTRLEFTYKFDDDNNLVLTRGTDGEKQEFVLYRNNDKKTIQQMKLHIANKMRESYYSLKDNAKKKEMALNIIALYKAGFFKREGGKIENFIRKKYEKGNI